VTALVSVVLLDLSEVRKISLHFTKTPRSSDLSNAFVSWRAYSMILVRYYQCSSIYLNGRESARSFQHQSTYCITYSNITWRVDQLKHFRPTLGSDASLWLQQDFNSHVMINLDITLKHSPCVRNKLPEAGAWNCTISGSSPGSWHNLRSTYEEIGYGEPISSRLFRRVNPTIMGEESFRTSIEVIILIELEKRGAVWHKHDLSTYRCIQ